MRIRFSETCSGGAPDFKTFNDGQEYDLSIASANHWIRRMKAVEVSGSTAPEKAVMPKPKNAALPKPVKSPGKPKAVSDDG